MAGEIEVGRAAVRIFADDSAYWRKINEISGTRIRDITVTAKADTETAKTNIESLKRESAGADDEIAVTADADTATAKANIESLKRASAGADDEIDISVNRRGLAGLTAARSGIDALGERIRNLGEVMKLVKIPFLLAGIGGIPAVAASAAVGIGRLALGIGQGLTGAAVVGGTAVGGLVAGLGAYVGIAQNAITAGIEEAGVIETIAARYGGLGKYLDTLTPKIRDQVRVVANFGDEVQNLQASLVRLRSAYSVPILRGFTEVIRIANTRVDDLAPALMRLARGGTAVVVSFTKMANSAERFERIRRIFGFIASSGIRALQIAKNLGLALIAMIQPVLGPAAKLQRTFVGLSRSLRQWAESARGQRQIAQFIQVTWRRAQQLWRIIRNLVTGFKNLFSIVRPGTNNMMRSIIRVTGQFARLGAEGTKSRRAIERFVRASQPILRALWRLVKEAARQFFLLAGNVAEAGQSGKKMNPIVRILNSIRRALPQVRRLLQSTFKDLAPVIAPLIPQLARFFRQFAGSTGVLRRVLRIMTGVLRIFNHLPQPVKDAVAELIAFRLVSRILGFTVLGRLALNLGKILASMLGIGRKTRPAARGLESVGKKGRYASGGMLALGRNILLIAWPIALAAAFGDKLFNDGRGAKELTKQLHQTSPAIKRFSDRLKEANDKDHLAQFVNTLGTLSKGVPFDKIAAGMKKMGDESARQAKNSKNHTAVVVSAWGGAQQALVGRSIIPDMIRSTNKWLGPELKRGTTAAAGNARSMKDNVGARMREMNTNARSSMTALVNIIKGVNLVSVGTGIIQGLLNGMKSAWESARSWIQSIANAIPDTVKQVLQQGSPSRVMYQVGSDAIQGLINALQDGLRQVIGMGQKLGSSLVGRIPDQAVPDLGAMHNGRSLGRFALRHPYFNYGDVSERRWQELLSYGYKGRAGDSRERIYAPVNNISIHQHGDDDEATIREIRRQLRRLRRQRESRTSLRGGAT